MNDDGEMDILLRHAGGDMHVDEAGSAFDGAVDLVGLGCRCHIKGNVELRVLRKGHVSLDGSGCSEILKNRAGFEIVHLRPRRMCQGDQGKP